MKLLLKISYLGTNFCGYQIQNNARTVQGELNKASHRLFGYECDVTGCSRTDSGVHANVFYVSISKKGFPDLPISIPLENIPSAMNTYLPKDISVHCVGWMEEDFHPRYSVKTKEYEYRIYNCKHRDPFKNEFFWHYAKEINDLQFEQMQKAMSFYKGKKDFFSFMSNGSDIFDTVRTVDSVSLHRENNIIIFRIRADGFLYNMVRIMMGTLIYVSEGKILADDIPSILEAKDRNLAGMTAPAHGLYLNKVIY